jgi:hypothetical protein
MSTGAAQRKQAPGSATVAVDGAAVRRVLQAIIESPAFKGSRRSQQFLCHIVEKALSGHSDDLKERSLGVELFGRSSSYDTGEDAIVRVTASDVRKRLHHFYSEAEAEIRIEIPSGSYTPEFRRVTLAAAAHLPAAEVETVAPALPEHGRRRRMRVRMVYAAALAVPVIASCLWLLPGSSRMQPKNVLPWSALFGHGRSVQIVFADPDISTMQEWLGYQISLSDYANRRYLPAGQSFGAELERALRSLRGSNVAAVDVGIALSVSRLAAASSERVETHPSRSLQLRDLKTDDSFVLLGSPRSNPWTGLFQDQLDLDFMYDSDLKQEIIRNKLPKQGEAARYVPTAKGFDTGQAFAVVALVGNGGQNNPALLLAGTNAEATAAAGEFVSNLDQLSRALRKSGIAPGGPVQHFEALLQVRTMAGSPTTFELIACHLLQNASSP